MTKNAVAAHCNRVTAAAAAAYCRILNRESPRFEYVCVYCVLYIYRYTSLPTYMSNTLARVLYIRACIYSLYIEKCQIEIDVSYFSAAYYVVTILVRASARGGYIVKYHLIYFANFFFFPSPVL